MSNTSKRITLSLALFFVLASFTCVLAKDESSAASEQETAQKMVTAIEVKGSKSISPNTVTSKIKTRIGSPYLENIVSDDLKRLYLLGYFSDIKIDTEDYKGGVKVIISVVEKPIIGKITFEGMKKLYYLKPEKLKEQIKAKEGQYLDYNTLKDDVATLKGIYEKKGFADAKIDYRIDQSTETNKVNVAFVVAEGAKAKVKKIYVEGNKAFSDRRILKLIKTKTAWLFNAGVLKDEVFQEDIERVKSFYRHEGFSDVKVDYTIRRHPTKPFIYITLNIEEGKRYYVGNVSIEGNRDLTEKQIRDKLAVVIPGKVFSNDGLQEDENNILSLYFDKGYIMARVSSTSALNPETNKIDIAYNITENEISYVDKIKIRGNIKTKDVVIRRELKILPGERFDGDKLRRSKERLTNLGFFEDVGYETEATSVPNKRNLIVDVKETKTGSFSFGGGYSTVDKILGFVEVEQKNFDWKNFPYFTGAGQDLKLRAQLGSISSDYSLSFTEPWLFDYPVSFGFDAYKETHDRDEGVGYGYKQDVSGGDLRLGRALTDHVRADIMYKYDVIKISDIDVNATQDLQKEQGQNTISSITFGMGFDSRNNIFAPTRGNLLTGSVQGAGLGGDKDFYKFFGMASHFFPLVNNSALELRLRAGLSAAYGKSDDVPIYERFFAGG
ncbi:MAG: outer membrane protein assembly factor BamA, partial [Candidatus Omnitrophica bacterium]|nr:outer membrane protein assembly factor BamA [Candidatus Omnitrophota bacterium]